MVVAPATANILAKAAYGIADDLVSATLLAFPGPILMAPAMNTVMWNKPATARNIRRLSEDGVHFVGPASGHLGCGDTGAGRMAEPEEIFSAIERLFPQ
ncbi:MAG: phosphopantothenoylcysteine decarboxylase, partial [Thermoguttaceae bacterium]|nr:phosphopantothenoylcysteine decarboxylase [Thermoguttaceae bacterium]